MHSYTENVRSHIAKKQQYIQFKNVIFINYLQIHISGGMLLTYYLRNRQFREVLLCNIGLIAIY